MRSLGIGQAPALLEQVRLEGDRRGRIERVDLVPDLPLVIVLGIGKVGLHGLRNPDPAVRLALPEDVDVVPQARVDVYEPAT
jgi:hypothetical protein